MTSTTSPLSLRSTSRPAVPRHGLVELQTQIYHETRQAGQPPRQLMTWLLDRRNLAAAWERVASADGAATPGEDGVTCDSIGADCAAWLARLTDELYRGHYRPGRPRWLDVPKAHKPGCTRRLGILTVRDRVVHAALKQVLEPVLEPTFPSTSFGFRPGRSVPGALAEAVRLLSDPPVGDPSPFPFAVHLDVADCFDTVDHTLLLAELGRRLADAQMLDLLAAVLAAGGTGVRRLWRLRGRGLVQGSALSPLLCNLALHPLDLELQALAQASEGGVSALRYADDLLLLARDSRLAARAVALTRKVLGRLQQRLGKPDAVARPSIEGVDWLGVTLRPRRQPWAARTAFGYVVPDGRVADMLARLTEMTTPPSERIDGAAFNPARWVVSINDQLRDWRQAYLFADNAPEVFRALDEHARERVAGLLQALTGARRGRLFDEYQVRLPRGFWTWEVQGARLVVLSSQAPHNPGRLTRRPAWMTTAPCRSASGPAASCRSAGVPPSSSQGAGAASRAAPEAPLSASARRTYCGSPGVSPPVGPVGTGHDDMAALPPVAELVLPLARPAGGEQPRNDKEVS